MRYETKVSVSKVMSMEGWIGLWRSHDIDDTRTLESTCDEALLLQALPNRTSMIVLQGDNGYSFYERYRNLPRLCLRKMSFVIC
jgi:hypothetical protein